MAEKFKAINLNFILTKRIYSCKMRSEWDAGKRRRNFEKHGIDFLDAQKIFSYPMLTRHDGREDYGEERWIGIGLMEWLVVVVVFTEPKEGATRIISARKAKKHEKESYQNWLKDRLG